MNARDGVSIACCTWLAGLLAGAGMSGFLHEDHPPAIILCGDALSTNAEDDACVTVPLWAVEGRR